MTDKGMYMDTRQAGQFLGLSSKTLSRYRVSGDGPVFHRFGTRIRYRREDLEAWATTRRRASTSDDGTASKAGLRSRGR